MYKTGSGITARASGEWFWLLSSFGRSYGRLSWRGKVDKESWWMFKDSLVKAQEWSIPVSRTLSKYVRRTVELLSDLRCKNEKYRKWKQVQIAKEEEDIFP